MPKRSKHALRPIEGGKYRTYTPHETQRPFHTDPAKFRLLLGAWRSGKTLAAVWEAIMTGMEYPGALIGVFRKTYPALRDSTKRDFIDQIPVELIENEVRTEGKESVELRGGSQYWFRCLDDWKKLGSYAFDFVLLDEAYEASEEDFQMLAFGRLSGKVGPRKMVLCTNPPNIDHWLYKRFVTERTEQMSVHHFRTLDNQANLSPDYIAQLESMPSAWKRKFFEGQWGYLATGEPVYNEFREELHVARLKVMSDLPILRGWDFGFRHPACVWVQSLSTGHINVLAELLGTNEDLPRFIGRVKEHSRVHFPRARFEDYVDAAGVQKHDLGISAVQIMRRPEHNLVPNYRRLPLMRSIDSIRWLIGKLVLGRPLLQVDASCRLVIEGFSGGYAMDPKKDEPLKDGEPYEHLMDALRMAVAPVSLPFFNGVWAVRAERISQPRIAV